MYRLTTINTVFPQFFPVEISGPRMLWTLNDSRNLRVDLIRILVQDRITSNEVCALDHTRAARENNKEQSK